MYVVVPWRRSHGARNARTNCALEKKSYREIFFLLSANCLATVFTMAKIKKKGMLEEPIFMSITNIAFRHFWPGQKLHHSYPGRAQTSDLSSRLSSPVHFQG